MSPFGASSRSVASAGMPVAPSAIRDELTKAWKSAAGMDSASDKETGSAGRVRATLENLIIVAEDDGPQLAHRLDELITTLAIGHPSRFFVVAPRKDGKAELHTAVSSRCVLASSGEHVCTEEIYIAASAGSIEHVRNLILSLLVSDVATRLIVLGDPQSSDFASLIRQTVPLAERVIFDSRNFTSFAGSLSSMQSVWDAALKDSSESSLGVSGEVNEDEYVFRDVNWRRLRRWRDLIREQFDRACFSDAADRLEVIELSSGLTGPQVLSSDLLLLSAWIARAIGLQLGGAKIERLPDALNCSLINGDRALKFVFRQDEGVHDPGVCKVYFSFTGDVPGLRLAEGSEQEGITISVGGDDDDCDFDVRHVPLIAPSLEELIYADIISNSVGSEFKAVFAGAKELAALC